MKRTLFALLTLLCLAVPAAAQFNAQQTYVTATGGTGTAITILLNNVTQLTDVQGVPVCAMMSQSVTGGPATLQINTLAAVTVKKPTASGLADLANGDVVNGQQACFKYDGAFFELTGPNLNLNTVQATSGFDVPINLQINCTAAANALTCALKAANINADPTALAPIYIPFASTTTTSGAPVWETVTAAASMTFAGGNTAGCSSGAPCRLWITAIDNGGTVLVGLSNQSTSTACSPLNEGVLQTTGTGTSGGSTAGTIYTSVSAVSTKAVRIIGYVEWTTLVTAGNWTSPNFVRLFGPGIKKPCDPVQTVRTSTGALATGTTVVAKTDTIPTNTTGDQYMSLAITPSSPANWLVVEAQGFFANSSGSAIAASLFQDSTANALATGFFIIDPSNDGAMIHLNYNAQGTASATTFKLRAGGASGTTTFNGQGGGRLYGGVVNSYMIINEIMGALEPANDDGPPLRMVG